MRLRYTPVNTLFGHFSWWRGCQSFISICVIIAPGHNNSSRTPKHNYPPGGQSWGGQFGEHQSSGHSKALFHDLAMYQLFIHLTKKHIKTLLKIKRTLVFWTKASFWRTWPGYVWIALLKSDKLDSKILQGETNVLENEKTSSSIGVHTVLFLISSHPHLVIATLLVEAYG